jgi:hypothetical protein
VGVTVSRRATFVVVVMVAVGRFVFAVVVPGVVRDPSEEVLEVDVARAALGVPVDPQPRTRHQRCDAERDQHPERRRGEAHANPSHVVAFPLMDTRRPPGPDSQEPPSGASPPRLVRLAPASAGASRKEASPQRDCSNGSSVRRHATLERRHCSIRSLAKR